MDWLGFCLAILIFLIFAAIISLLRTMSSPYIKRFEAIVKSRIEPLAEAEESYRIQFSFDGRDLELLELKHASKEDFKRVYNSFILLKAKSRSTFTLRMDDVLSKVNIAGVLEEMLNEKIDHSAFQINAKNYSPIFKDFRVSTNDADLAEKFLTDPEVLSILQGFKTQFSAYGFLMSFVVTKGALIIDYSLSERLLNELIFNPRNILEHARLLNVLAGHIETKSSSSV